eukprot:3519181-Prymnesium_polylepis.1
MGPDQDPRDVKRVTGAQNQLFNLVRWPPPTPGLGPLGGGGVWTLESSHRPGGERFFFYTTVTRGSHASAGARVSLSHRTWCTRYARRSKIPLAGGPNLIRKTL